MPASTVTVYLAALPADRRNALNKVRRGINRALPPGYKEGIQFGMNSQKSQRCPIGHTLQSVDMTPAMSLSKGAERRGARKAF
jgi:hypothetical protein